MLVQLRCEVGAGAHPQVAGGEGAEEEVAGALQDGVGRHRHQYLDRGLFQSVSLISDFIKTDLRDLRV